jgi:hypothetical protein
VKDSRVSQQDSATLRTNRRISFVIFMLAIALFAGIGVAAWCDLSGSSQSNKAPNSATSIDAASQPGSASEQERKPQPTELPEDVRKDITYYNSGTPASKLAKLYTDALAESVKNKDVNACQTGLKDFGAQLGTMPLEVRTDLDENYSSNDRKIPSTTTYLTADHISYACQQATRLDLMSDLKFSSSGRQAVEAIDSDYVTTLKDGSKVCFDILSKDYYQAVGRSTAADKVMLTLTSLTLPQELTDKQFATVCDYKLPEKV